MILWSFSPFFDFYLNFKVIFWLISLLKSQKRGVFWSTGPVSWRGEAVMWRGGDVARGTTSECDVALRPHGRAADGPRGAWVTRVHVSYILYNIHIISLLLELANLSHLIPYSYASFPFIFSVWDYVPTWFLPCRTRGGTIGVKSSRLWSQGIDRVDPSPRNRHIKHVLQMGSKGIWSDDLLDAMWRHEKCWIFIKSRLRKIAIGPLTYLKINWTVQTLRRRTPWSRCDRAAIGERTWWNRLYDERTTINKRSGPRSWPDRGPIVARSRPDRGPIVVKNDGYSSAKLTPIYRGIEATTSPQGTAPTKPWISLHDCVNCQRSSGQFPSLKACISFLCS